MTEQQDGAFNHEQDAKMVFETSGDVKVINSFEDMKLKEELLRGIFAYSIAFLSLSILL